MRAGCDRPGIVGRAQGLAFALVLAAMTLAPVGVCAQTPYVRDLQLRVFVNDVDTQLIAAFRQDAAGRLHAQPRELKEVGLQAPADAGADQWIALERVTTLTYVYDEPGQTLRARVEEAGRARKSYAMQGVSENSDQPAERSWGAALNYDLFASSSWSGTAKNFAYQGFAASLDARVFTPVGTLAQTGVVSQSAGGRRTALRLDTTLSYSDPHSMTSYRAGDVISGALAWTRPIRLGGLQAQRNFLLRPDLIVAPLPAFSGSAAVPTEVDVYVNNVKTASQRVESGPYLLSDLPLSGSGSAQVVTVDAAGRRVERELSYFVSSRLLREGLLDFSVEAGFPRMNYGVDSFDYSKSPVLSASARRGFTDWLTGEAHGEFAKGFGNLGLGVVTSVAGRAIVSAAVSGSATKRGFGFSPYFALETRVGPVTIGGSYQRSFGAYEDLASITARDQRASKLDHALSQGIIPFSLSARPPREVARVNLSSPIPALGVVSGGLARVVESNGLRTTVATLALNRAGPWRSSLYLSAFASIAGKRNYGVFAGASIPLGEFGSVSIGGSNRNGELSWGLDAARALSHEEGSVGWRARAQLRPKGDSEQFASLAYRSRYGVVEAGASQYGRSGQGWLRAQGAVGAVAGGGIAVTSRIDDAFAIIDAGAPGVPVLVENRVIGTTGFNGKLIAPTLRSWQTNKIAIDATALPAQAAVAQTERQVRPAERHGLSVDFGVDIAPRAAVVVLTDAIGAPLPAGSRLSRGEGLPGGLVGYDGRVYLTGLQASNEVSVETRAGACIARFEFVASEQAQQTIGPVRCDPRADAR